MVKFCDWVPCVLLQNMIKQMSDSNTDEAIQIRVESRYGASKLVSLYYCPFCGTRIDKNKDILLWAKINGSNS